MNKRTAVESALELNAEEFDDLFGDVVVTEPSRSKRPRYTTPSNNAILNDVVVEVTPIATNPAVESMETVQTNKRKLDEVEELLTVAQDLVQSGAPDHIVEPAVAAVEVKISENLPTTPLRPLDPRAIRLRMGMDMLKDYLLTRQSIDSEELRHSFAISMAYVGKDQATDFSQLAIDLALDAILRSPFEDPEVKNYALKEKEKSLKLGHISMGTIQRVLFNIRMIVNRLGASLFKYSERAIKPGIKSPYTRAYSRYFNYANPDNSNLMYYVLRDDRGPNNVTTLYKVHDVAITTGDKKVATTIYNPNTDPTKLPTAYYDPTISGVDNGFINALKTSHNNVINSFDFSQFCDEVIQTSSKNFFGRGDITSLALRLVKVFKVYTQSQLWKSNYSRLVGKTWVFNDAINEIGELEQLKSQLPPGTKYSAPKAVKNKVWSSGHDVGATGFQRAMWYFGDYLGYGRTSSQDGFIYGGSMDCNLTGMIGVGSDYVEPSTWLLAFFKKQHPTEQEWSDANAMDLFTRGEDGELFRYVSSGLINPINLKSEAGCPYPKNVKKVDALGDIFVMANKVYRGINQYNMKEADLKRYFPEIFCVVVKPKAEVFPLEMAAPIVYDRPDESADVRPFLDGNEYLPKGRGIFVPCSWTAIPFGFLTSFISHSYESLFKRIFDSRDDVSRIYTHELENPMIPLKDMTFSHGMFDFFFRRVQCMAPFDTQKLIETGGFGLASYSDNFYAFGPVDEPFTAEEDTICLRYSDGGYINIPGMSVLPGDRVYISADGEKAESATDEADCYAYLSAMCDFFKMPPDVSRFIMEAARFTVNGGVCLFGNKQLHLPWQGSGNQLTFSLNDFKMAQVLHHYKNLTDSGRAGKINWPVLKEVATFYGASVTLERLIVLPPIGTPVAQNNEEVDVDLLGLSAMSVTASNFVGPGPTVVPILSKDRRIKALCFSKTHMKETSEEIDLNQGNTIQEAQAGFVFAVKAISMLLTGCVLVPHEKDVCYNAIIMYARAIRAETNKTARTDILNEIVDATVDTKALLATVDNVEFQYMLEAVSSMTIERDAKLMHLDNFFVSKYLLLVSCPHTYVRRQSYVNTSTHSLMLGGASPYSSKTVLFPVYPDFKIGNGSYRDFKSGYIGSQIYNAIVQYDAYHTEKWPAAFDIGENGNIIDIKYEFNSPVFKAKIKDLISILDPEAQNHAKISEMLRRGLRWYLIDHPYRVTGYDAALRNSSEARTAYTQRLIASIPKTRTTTVASDNATFAEAFYMRAPYNTVGMTEDQIKPVTVGLDETRNLDLKLNSGVASGKIPNPTFINGYTIKATCALRPGISLNPYLEQQHDTMKTAANWKYPSRFIFRLHVNKAKISVRYARAIVVAFYAILKVSPVVEMLVNTSDEDLNLYRDMSGLWTTNPIPTYRPELKNFSPLQGTDQYYNNTVDFASYHISDKPTFPGDVANSSMFYDQTRSAYLSPTSALCIETNLNHLALFIQSKGAALSTFPPGLQKDFEKLSEKLGGPGIRKVLRFLLTTPPLEQVVLAQIPQLIHSPYNSNAIIMWETLKTSLAPYFNDLSSLRVPSPVELLGMVRPLARETKLIVTENGRRIPNPSVQSTIGTLLWQACEREMGANLAKIVRLVRTGSPATLDIAIRDRSTDISEVTTVWDCYYTFCALGNLDTNMKPKPT